VTVDGAWVVVAWPEGTRDAVRADEVVTVRPVDRAR
jgi:hypothetical protein